jgi:hypothetical protein
MQQKNREKRREREREKRIWKMNGAVGKEPRTLRYTRSELLSGFTRPPSLPLSQYRTHFHATLKSHTTLKSHAMS